MKRKREAVERVELQDRHRTEQKQKQANERAIRNMKEKYHRFACPVSGCPRRYVTQKELYQHLC